MCASEVLRGPADVPRQLLLLAVVHHGGRPRQGLLVQGDRDAVREPARRARASSTTAAVQGLGALVRRSRQGRLGVSRSPALRRRREQFLRAPPGRRPHRSRARLRASCAGAAYMATFDADALDDHPRRRAVLRALAQDAVADARRRCASCRTRSCAASSATPTATSPTTATRMQELKLRPEDIRGQDDLHKLPLLTKDDVRKHLYFDIMAREPRQDARCSNLDQRLDRRAVRRATPTAPSSSSAGRRRCARRSGPATSSATACVRLWHQTLGMSQVADRQGAAPTPASRNRKFIPVFEMQRRQAGRDGRATIAALAADAARRLRRGARLPRALPQEHGGNVDVQPQGASCRARRPSPTGSRKLIEEAFGCRVFDKYGAREFSRHRLRVRGARRATTSSARATSSRCCGTARPAAPGRDRRGRHHRSQQLLPAVHPLSHRRSRRGDGSRRPAAPAAAACRASATSRAACSRSSRAPTGRYLPGTFFAHYLKEFDHAIQRFQVVQERASARSPSTSSRAGATPTRCWTRCWPPSASTSATT